MCFNKLTRLTLFTSKTLLLKQICQTREKPMLLVCTDMSQIHYIIKLFRSDNTSYGAQNIKDTFYMT